MEPIRIDIPDAKTPVMPDARAKAADILAAALAEAGVEPRKAAGVPLVREAVREWLHGELSRAEFVDILRKIAILNPSISAGPA